MGKLMEDRQIYEAIETAFQAPLIAVHAVYGPGNTSLYPDWYCAVTDLFRRGLTFRVYFTLNEDGEIRVEHLEEDRA